MYPKTHGNYLPIAFVSLIAAGLLVAGCSSGSQSTPPTNSNVATGSSFVIGTDAPMASVTSFSVQIQSVEAMDADGKSASLVSGMPTVDFARYNGLQTLLDMNDVPADTYTSIAITLGPATLGYLDTSGSGAPTIQTEAATLTTPTINVTL